jgi:excisionase family DNA binding protein
MPKQNQQSEVVGPLDRRAMSIREFADALSVSFDSAYRRVQAGEVKSVRFGRRVLIPQTELERILAEGL